MSNKSCDSKATEKGRDVPPMSESKPSKTKKAEVHDKKKIKKKPPQNHHRGQGMTNELSVNFSGGRGVCVPRVLQTGAVGDCRCCCCRL